MKELWVITNDPAGLDKTVQQLGGFVSQDADGTYHRNEDGSYSVRGTDVEFLRFAIMNQGYGKVVDAVHDAKNAVLEPSGAPTQGAGSVHDPVTELQRRYRKPGFS